LRSNLAGCETIIQKLKVNLDTGLTGVDFPQRTEHFGNNYREPLKAKSFGKILLAALDDFMLKILIVCALISIFVEMILAEPHEREHGKHQFYPRAPAAVWSDALSE